MGFLPVFFARKFYKISETFLFSLEGKAVAGNLSRTALVFQEDSNGTRLLVAFRPIFSFVPSKRWYFDASIDEFAPFPGSNFIFDQSTVF